MAQERCSLCVTYSLRSCELILEFLFPVKQERRAPICLTSPGLPAVGAFYPLPLHKDVKKMTIIAFESLLLQEITCLYPLFLLTVIASGTGCTAGQRGRDLGDSCLVELSLLFTFLTLH